MSAVNGRDMLVKVKHADGPYETVAGLRTKALRLNARTIDVTHSESADMWRELLPGSGIKSAEIRGTGIFTDTSSAALIRSDFFDQMTRDYRFILPGFGQIDGTFLIAALNYSGTYAGEANWDVTLQSAGVLRFTPEPVP